MNIGNLPTKAEMTLEDLKKEIRSYLQTIDTQRLLMEQADQTDQPDAVEAIGDETQLDIYLVCDQRGERAVRDWRSSDCVQFRDLRSRASGTFFERSAAKERGLR